MSGGRQHIAVEPRVVKELLVDRLFEDANARARGPLAAEPAGLVDAALHAVAGRLPDGSAPHAQQAAAAVARMGYESRSAELAAFARAREPAEWLLAELRSRGDGDLSAELALREPAELPDPADERAASWRVPGPGGHVRHWLAARSVAAELERSPGEDPRLLRRAWFYGFYLRSCAEARASAS